MLYNIFFQSQCSDTYQRKVMKMIQVYIILLATDSIGIYYINIFSIILLLINIYLLLIKHSSFSHHATMNPIDCDNYPYPWDRLSHTLLFLLCSINITHLKEHIKDKIMQLSNMLIYMVKVLLVVILTSVNMCKNKKKLKNVTKCDNALISLT